MKKCDHKFVWNPSSCKCGYKRKAPLLVEECEIIDKKTVPAKKHNKTVSIKEHNKYLNNSFDSCKPFVPSSILFFLVSVIITGLFVYFHVKKKIQDYH